jgi:sterol desaturase/sphingolipid hydroxylase (fatty acid hydroxylase superfamily)
VNFHFLATSVRDAVFTVLIAILLAEFIGYALHRALHSNRFPLLSRPHMIHHLEIYGPDQAMRSPEYRDSTEGRLALGNIGMEWVAPVVAILAVAWIALYRLGIHWCYRVLSISTLLAWAIVMLSYLHDRMHLQNFWMERAPIVKIWFRRARRMHDIHHRALDDHGRMHRNFGIGFFLFDWLLGTLAKRHGPLNWKGVHSAVRRHNPDLGSKPELSNVPSQFHT